MPIDIRVSSVTDALTAMGAAQQRIAVKSAEHAEAAIAALPGPEIVQAPAGAANLARPNPQVDNGVDKGVDTTQATT